MATIDKIRVSGTTYDIIDSTAIHSLNGYATQNDVTAATQALAESIAEQGYQTSGDVQNAISGKVDTSAYTAYTSATQTALGNKLEESDVAGLFGAVVYDDTTKRINFKHSATGEVIAYVDATDFVKDGMVSNVQITNGNLVITFNTDAGKEAITIPLTSIFDPSNYYTTAQTDTKISEATSGKVDTSTYNTYTAATDSAIAGKQATLVSGTNIKTINNSSILGSGNIDIVTTVDSALSSSSENPVQNKVVKSAIDAKNQVITLDGTTLVVS